MNETNTQEANSLTRVADGYIALWNETDAQKRRELMAQLWTEDATYQDPMMKGEGYSEIDALIEGVHVQFPGYRFKRVGEVDGVGNHARFSWHLAPESQDEEQPALVGGTDFCALSEDGRIQTVTGFVDFAPNLPS